MAKKKGEPTIYDLPGVGAATAEKLKDAGFDNLMAIAVATPGELTETAGVGEAAARKIINFARNNLDMGFVSGNELLEKRNNLIRITTGSKTFDTLVGGGFESGGITECFGAFGAGKSALAHMLAVTAQLPKDKGGAEGAVVWIDTENTFRPERIKEICESKDLDPEEFLKNIRVVRAYNSDHQMIVAEKVEDLIKKENLPIKLVIVDSLMAHFRAEFCVTPEMEVIGNPSVKMVRDFKNGDKVLTHKGRFSNVLGVNKITYNGKIVKVTPCYMDTFTLTPDHSVLAVKSIRSSWYKNQSKYRARDKNNYLKVFNSKKYYKVYEGYGPDWIMAGTLEKGDYLAYPIVKEVADKDHIPIVDYIDSEKFCVKKDKIKSKGYHNRETYEKVIEAYNKAPEKGRTTELSKRYNLPVSTVYQWVSSNQGVRDDIVELDVNIPINKSSMRLFGYYLAEGHVNDHQVIFTFGEKEEAYIKDVKNLMKKVWGVKANKGYVGDGSHRVVFSSTILAEFFGNIFGRGATKKHMPKWMLFLPKNKQKEIIKGHWRGDGTTSFDGYRFDTTSRVLAEQLKQIILRFNVIPCFRIDRNGRENPKYIIEVFGKQIARFGEILRAEGHKCIKRRKYTYNNGWIDRDYAFLPIRKIEEINYEGDLYNLEVEKDSSYALNSVAVHNCGRGTLAERQQKLNKHMHVLMKLADIQNLCVYVTNQVMAKPDMFFGDPTAAIGGNIVGHNSCTRIYLRRGKAGSRVSKLIDSPHLPDGEAIWKIDETGIADV